MDLIEGTCPYPPSVILSFVLGLPDTSLTFALASGSRDFHGWGQDRYLLADLFDALNVNTQATGNWKGKPPKFDPYQRPRTKPKKATVAALFARTPKPPDNPF